MVKKVAKEVETKTNNKQDSKKPATTKKTTVKKTAATKPKAETPKDPEPEPEETKKGFFAKVKEKGAAIAAKIPKPIKTLGKVTALFAAGAAIFKIGEGSGALKTLETLEENSSGESEDSIDEEDKDEDEDDNEDNNEDVVEF